MYHSIIRGEEYRLIGNLNLTGAILDIGGSKKSGYHELISGVHTFTVVNIDKSCEPDLVFDVEKPFPVDDESFDHSICLNVIEHLFEFENAFSEQVRCIKKGGKIVIAAPFMHFIHGSPDDYLRYTESSYKRLAKKYKLRIIQINPVGFGLCSLVFQFISVGVPTNFLKSSIKHLSVFMDKFLCRISGKYRTLASKIPLGYFVVFEKT